MKYIVTGGCGFVGTILVPSLLEKGHKVTVVDILWFGNHLTAHPNLEVIEGDVRDVEKIPMDGVEYDALTVYSLFTYCPPYFSVSRTQGE